MKAVFSSRRENVTDDQLKELGDLLGTPITKCVVEETKWSATQNPLEDIQYNVKEWLRLKQWSNGGVVIGDFPHAALEALAILKGMNVYVRVYEIGGGFKRDTEWLRWAKISG